MPQWFSLYRHTIIKADAIGGENLFGARKERAKDGQKVLFAQTVAEIIQVIEDYRNGRMGNIGC